MTITSNKCQKELLTLGNILCVLSAVFFYFAGSWIWSITFFLVMSIVSYMQWQGTGKKIIINQYGCVIRFLWFEKQYAWQELSVRKYVDYSKTIEIRSGSQEGPIYMKGAEFSVKPIHRPKWLSPIVYSQLVNPMSFFFVYFQPADFIVNDARYPTIYMVDEGIFREKMLEWNVQVKE